MRCEFREKLQHRSFIGGIIGAALKRANVKNSAYVSVLRINFC